MSFRLLVTHIPNAQVSWIYSLWRTHRAEPKSAHPVRMAKHEQENPTIPETEQTIRTDK